MTSRQLKDDCVLIPRSIVIIFKEKKHKRGHSKQESQVPISASLSLNSGKPVPKTGQELFEDFVDENKICHWNPHLEESVKGLKYAGCLHPSTLLVTGREIFLDTVKGAWARRALRAPVNFNISKVGELSGLSFEPIPQAHFTPLPEALCQIISDITRADSNAHDPDLLRRLQVGASLDAILDTLQDVYRGMQLPSEHIVYETLGSLMKERKIYHTGSGYGIVSPETFQLTGCLTVKDNHLVIGEGPNGERGPTTLVIPLSNGLATLPLSPPKPSPPVAEVVSISCQTDDNVMDSPGSPGPGKFDRSMSMRESGRSKRGETPEITRSLSMKDGNEVKLKDINLKTSDVHQEKDKGEKSSLLNKLFGRGKSKRSSSAGRGSVDGGGSATEDKVSNAQPPKEYATFSAQFPPPEWQWYEEQHRAPDRAATWHHDLPAPRFPDDSDSNDSDTPAYDCPVHRASTLPPGAPYPGFSMIDPVGCKENPYSEDPLGFFSPRKMQDSLVLDNEGNGAPAEACEEVTPPGKSGKNRKHHRKHRHKRLSKDVSRLNKSGISPCQEAVRPKEGVGAEAEEEEPREGEPGEEEEPQPLLNNAQVLRRLERPTHVSRVFKKYREMKCGSFLSNDINIEFQGQLDKKSTRFTKSRDSGVNCIGLDSMNNNFQLSTATSPPEGGAKETNLPKDSKSQPNPEANQVRLTAEVHRSPETNLHEDSGFNSPRTNGVVDPHYNNAPFSQGYLREGLHSNSEVPLPNRNLRQSQSPEGENLYESILRTESDVCPVANKENQSSNWSDSSKQTVQEVTLRSSIDHARKPSPLPSHGKKTQNSLSPKQHRKSKHEHSGKRSSMDGSDGFQKSRSSFHKISCITRPHSDRRQVTNDDHSNDASSTPGCQKKLNTQSLNSKSFSDPKLVISNNNTQGQGSKTDGRKDYQVVGML